jgi:hypothetical protein
MMKRRVVKDDPLPRAQLGNLAGFEPSFKHGLIARLFNRALESIQIDRLHHFLPKVIAARFSHCIVWGRRISISLGYVLTCPSAASNAATTPA